jgi:hypothetical protein
MKPLVVGTREDVAGFALAGIEGVVCSTREEMERVIAEAGEDTLVIVSASANGDPHPPFGHLLPSRGEGQRGTRLASSTLLVILPSRS